MAQFSQIWRKIVNCEARSSGPYIEICGRSTYSQLYVEGATFEIKTSVFLNPEEYVTRSTTLSIVIRLKRFLHCDPLDIEDLLQKNIFGQQPSSPFFREIYFFLESVFAQILALVGSKSVGGYFKKRFQIKSFQFRKIYKQAY